MRHPARLFLTGAALLVAASCTNDSTVAPSVSSAPTVRGASALAALSTPTTVDFVIPAAGGRVNVLGFYSIDFPANSVCDPSAEDTKAGYAAGAWDAPCTILTEDITVHATLKWSHNRLWADFSPSLRFNPSQTVTLSTDLMSPIVRYFGEYAMQSGLSKKWGLLYADQIDGRPTDDSRFDATLRTSLNFTTGTISRRIKHFTGYNIITGALCVITWDDPYCVDLDEPPIGHG